MLGIDAALDGVAAQLNRQGDDVFQPCAGGDQDLSLDQIDSRDALGHRMLHLDAGVNFDEVELALLIHQELDGAGVRVSNAFERDLEAGGDFGTQGRRHSRRRRLFNKLLMAALDGAFPLPEHFDSPMVVTNDLKLDVARSLDEFLHVDVAVRKRRLGFVARLRQEIGEFFRVPANSHAAAAAAGRCLQDDRETDALRQFDGLFRTRHHGLRPGQNRHAVLLHDAAGFLLQAHRADDFRLGTDERDAARLANFGKAGVFAQESVAGMDGGRVGDLGRTDDRWDVQVAAGALGRADADGLIGETGVQRVAVRFRINRNRRDAEIFACANDAQRDLAAIGNQYLLKHAIGP